MAKIDKIKEFIGFLKAVFITAIAIMSSLIAYLYERPLQGNWIVLLALVINVIVVILLFKKIIKEINALEEIE